MKLLVTGGAGYVGSTVAARLVAAGHTVVVLDDLSTGHADAVPAGSELVVASLRKGAADVLADGSFDAVLHFAAKSVTGESVARPGYYWDQNLGESLALFDAMRRAGVGRIVFSSTAATYGNPENTPIRETDPTRPVSPYGATKLAIDTALSSYAELHGFGAVSLRYFNVAGAHEGLGERHEPETHLIANVLAVALGHKSEVSLFGTDYPTPDGTCVRDYIHVSDLAEAHLLALNACEPGRHRVYNLGSGSGHSVAEVIEVCRKVTGHPIPVRTCPRRDGDPSVLVASSEKIFRELGWTAERDLLTMVSDAWAFARSLPHPDQT
ncbi:UDP-glucose 4-epimerase GalE [Streptomyces virens]|jgi:UDP-glucose 4-epimerase|uniref:UDP-glucose 4-epimerase n=2 Tax=Streptomyces TaxID=1883 RepID=A0A514JL99_9ACTN|nr:MULTISPECIES: UDP-glucose 4-epimerase GalE [Streptomyces]MBA8942233.1 UDP-glucose 4-epimerase [Streptomyces calvus]MBA8975830.1 UDP-glucose 4-epimerase [Streptomyces calvus]MYS28530.1 UDP-glucose 4-epimerase GalE [Streptomyces sp. SID7804]MYS30296.1 UDP-glucose 4-epimerase GalE [Streptomyces sp. SID7804]QDI68097.1 UDP-glucose 4-epimerase GalE [Streptomyces calvus]